MPRSIIGGRGRGSRRITGFAMIASAMLLAAPVQAQSLPGGLTQDQLKAIPPDVLTALPSDIWTRIPAKTLAALPPDLFRNIPPGLLSKIPPNAASMTPQQAMAYYRSLDPAQQKSLKQTAKQLKSQIEAVPGLMDQIKAVIRSYRGS